MTISRTMKDINRKYVIQEIGNIIGFRNGKLLDDLTDLFFEMFEEYRAEADMD